MNRETALEFINEKVKNKNLIKHMLAAEACMKRLAEYFEENPDEWGFAGLVHDVDYDETQNEFGKHGLVSAELLIQRGVGKKIVNAVMAHASKKEIENKMEQALYAVDPITGLIVAAALMHPAKKLKEVDVQFVINRFREKRFAAGANRQQIESCVKLGLSLDEFTGLCLLAMQEISGDLGL